MTDTDAQPYPFDTDPPRKATREDFEAMARKLAEAEAKLKAAQPSPVPAQPAQAEGVEALADAIYATANQFDAHRAGLPEDYVEWANDVARRLRDHVAAARRLRNSPRPEMPMPQRYSIYFQSSPPEWRVRADSNGCWVNFTDAMDYAERLRNSPQPVSNGPFGAFYVCPTCSGTGAVTQSVHEEARLRSSPESPDGSVREDADWKTVPRKATGKMLAEARKRGKGLEECWEIMVNLAPKPGAARSEGESNET